MAAVCAVLLCFVPAVNGQWAVSLERPWQSQVTLDEIEIACTILQLTEDQHTTVQMLMSDHAAAYTEIVKEGKAFERESHQQLPPLANESEREIAVVQRLKNLTDFANRTAALDQEFFDNLAMILNPEQESLWTVYLRDRRWRHFVNFNESVPGATLNLHVAIETLELDDRQLEGLHAVMYEYDYLLDPMIDQMLDEAVRFARDEWGRYDRNRLRNEAGQRVLKEGRLDDYASTTRPFFIKEQRELHKLATPQVAIRQINIQFIERIADVLPSQRVDAFREAAFQRMHHKAFWRDTPAGRLISKALQLQDLTEEQHTDIVTIRDELDIAVYTANHAAARLEEDRFTQWWHNPLEEKRYGELSKKMQELDKEPTRLSDAAMVKIKSVLTEEQQAQVKRLPAATTATAPTSMPAKLQPTIPRPN